MAMMDGHISIAIDVPAGLVRVHGSGFWSVDAVRRHFAELETTLTAVRESSGKVCLLIDMRDAPIQPAATTSFMRNERNNIYCLADKIAMICESARLALEAQREANLMHFAAFDAVKAAENWLADTTASSGES